MISAMRIIRKENNWMCVVQARITDSGLNKWVQREAAKRVLKRCFCTINTKTPQSSAQVDIFLA